MTSDFTDTPLDDLRRSFESLGLQQKAEFLVEATFKTFASSVEKAGATLSHELDNLFASMERQAPDEPTEAPPPRPTEDAAPGAAEGASPPPKPPRSPKPPQPPL